MIRALNWKVCGMREPDNIRAVAQRLPQWMGFIFYSASPRYVGPSFQRPRLPESVQPVAVWVDAGADEVLAAAHAHQMTTVQLHGSESPALCARLRAAGLSVIKAFAIDETFAWHTLAPYEAEVDYFLFDTRGMLPGGTGRSFDWNLLRFYSGTRPFLLSGGLSPSHLPARAHRHPLLAAIDVNSGVEDRPGWKNLDKVDQIANWIRNENERGDENQKVRF